MAYFVGAYAASPNSQSWDPALETAYYERLKKLPNLKGLEHPFVGTLHPHDDAWFLRNIDPNWRYVMTCMPGEMTALVHNPNFGIASDNVEGRKSAIAFLRKACEAVGALNAACDKPVVDAVLIHTAPNKSKSSSSVAALKESLAAILEWDWQGARLLIEHCDAYVPGQLPAKGFLSLGEEIEAVLASNARFASNLGIVINWGRSVIEMRSDQGALQHIRQAKAKGLLAGLFFSGASEQDTAYGAWLDSHMPPAVHPVRGVGAIGSLLTETAMYDNLLASDHRNLAIVGLKIGIRPLDASLDERIAQLDSALESIAAQAAAIDDGQRAKAFPNR